MQETHGALKQDVMTLLEWYKRIVRRKKELGRDDDLVRSLILE